MKNVSDMTQGSILSKMIRFAIPVLFGMLFQRIYNFADVYIVGKYLGDDALAAVSIAGSAMYLFQSLIFGLTTGVSVVIAQYYGSGKHEKVRDTFITSIYVAIISTILITVLGVFGTKPLLILMQTGDDLLKDACTYLAIIFLGTIATMLYNWISAVLRSLGNSTVPLIFLILSSGLNILLDITLIAWIPLGVAGAAIATVLAQFVSGVLCLLYAWHILPFLRVKRKQLAFDKAIASLILKYGIPAGLQMSIISISDMTLQSVVNMYGTAMIVAYGVCMKVEAIGWQMTEAIGSSLGTFVGQNVGAGKMERVKTGVKYAYWMNIVCYSIFCPAIFFGAEQIMRVFTDSAASIQYGMEYIHIFSFFFFAGGFLVVYHNVLRAAGDVKVTILMGISEVLTRISFSFLFTAWFGYHGLWWVSPLTWTCAAIVGCIRYYSGKWQDKCMI
ncbi:MAG: MATE family efflux transporter [Lachnospiraceae bacterium]|nr:MATE family efflux transporter [Lachnospiraceae bacterium]